MVSRSIAKSEGVTQKIARFAAGSLEVSSLVVRAAVPIVVAGSPPGVPTHGGEQF